MSPRQEVLAGIRAYLHDHFPEVDFTEDVQTANGNVLFHGGHPDAHRLEVTEPFLDGVTGRADRSLNDIRVWKLARVLREASGRLVIVETAGLTIAPWKSG